MGGVTENKNNKYVNDTVCLKVISAMKKNKERTEGEKGSSFKQKSPAMLN